MIGSLVCFISLGIVMSRFIRVVAYVRIAFCEAKQCPVVWMWHSSSVGERLGCICLVAAVTDNEMNMSAQAPAISLLSVLCIH